MFVFSHWGEILQVWVCFQSLGRDITGLGLFSVGLSSYPKPYPGPERVQISQLVSVLSGLLQMMTIYCRYHYLSVFLLVSPLPQSLQIFGEGSPLSVSLNPWSMMLSRMDLLLVSRIFSYWESNRRSR